MPYRKTRVNRTSCVFYQNPFKGAETVFSGDLSTSRTPNFSLSLMMQTYLDSAHKFHFYLVLKNGIELSVCKEEKRHSLSIMQVRGDRITKHPDFSHDGFGEHTLFLHEFEDFVVKVGNQFPEKAYITLPAGERWEPQRQRRENIDVED